MHRRYLLSALTAFVAILVLTPNSSALDVDTTKVRQPERPPKPLTAHLLAAPSALLQATIWVPEQAARGVLAVTYDRPRLLQSVVRFLTADRPIYPIFGSTSNSGLYGGLGMHRRNLFSPGDRLAFSGWYSVFDYQHYVAGYEAPQAFGTAGGLSLHGEFSRAPREYFFGLGADSRENDEVSIGRERSLAGVDLTFHALPRLDITVHAGYNVEATFDGEDPDFEGDLDSIQVRLGIEAEDLRSMRYWTVGPQLRFDSRDLPGRPTSGGIYEGQLFYHVGVGRSDGISFTTARADLRQYVELFQGRVLVFRALAQSVDVLDKESNPRNAYYTLSQLGGEGDLRGFREHRFVAGDAILGSIEYRYPVWRAIDGMVFIDEGRVFDSFTDQLTFTNWRWTVGAGLRLWNPYGETFRMTFAFSEESFQFAFAFGLDY